eukprot:SAG31_NODE_12134_length_965_cov_0.890300_1_plen_202_part_10
MLGASFSAADASPLVTGSNVDCLLQITDQFPGYGGAPDLLITIFGSRGHVGPMRTPPRNNSLAADADYVLDYDFAIGKIGQFQRLNLYNLGSDFDMREVSVRPFASGCVNQSPTRITTTVLELQFQIRRRTYTWPVMASLDSTNRERDFFDQECEATSIVTIETSGFENSGTSNDIYVSFQGASHDSAEVLFDHGLVPIAVN